MKDVNCLKKIYQINLKYLGYKSFYGCECIEEIFLPKEIKYIGYN